MQVSAVAPVAGGARTLCLWRPTATTQHPAQRHSYAPGILSSNLRQAGGGWGTSRHAVATRGSANPLFRPQAFFEQAWSPSTLAGAASLAPQLFAASLLPYLVFLFFLHSSGKAPKLTLFGFYFLLLFVGATIPAGIYAKTHYGTALANVDWLHGSAESLLTITNLFIVLGLRQGIREEEAKNAQKQQDQGAARPGDSTEPAELQEQIKQ